MAQFTTTKLPLLVLAADDDLDFQYDISNIVGTSSSRYS